MTSWLAPWTDSSRRGVAAEAEVVRDLESISSLSEYEDPVAGIGERFLTPEIDGGRTVALLSQPLVDPRSIGWVVCHSFGLERDNLQTFEADLARRLASCRFPVLRYHSQGYGDSELPFERAGLRSHVQGAVDAATVLGRTTGVSAIGLIGSRFGGAVALLAADRLGAAAVALLDPVISGRAYMQRSIRSGLVARLAGGGRVPPPEEQEDPIQTMRRQGSVDLQGLPLRREVFEEISELELVRAVKRFRGRSLVMQVSRSEAPRREVEQLVEGLRELGGECDREIVVDRNALRFGLPRLRAVGPSAKVDVLADLSDTIAAAAVAWSLLVGGDAGGSREADRD